MMMNYVAVRIISRGVAEVGIHLPDVSGNYATLHGLIPLILIFLVACADPGVGGQPYDPNAAAWSAAATQTVASQQVTATSQANIIAATAGAAQVTAQAQATAVASAATAAPLATEAAELQSVAAIATATMAGILAAREQAASTATAVHIQAQIARDVYQAQKAQRVGEFWGYARVVFLVGAALMVWGAYKYVMPGVYARLVPSQDVVINGNGDVVALGRGYSAVQPPPAAVQEERAAPPSALGIPLDIRTPKGIIQIEQPRPGAFANWLRAVMDDENRIQFSQNMARDRGWSMDQFGVMRYELRQAGWLHDIDGNGVYRMTDEGRRLARAWLGNGSTSPTPPPQNGNY